MTYAVSSAFIDSLYASASSPQRRLLVGGSDYSARVDKWPTIKRTTTDLRAVNPQIPLRNEDGALNFWFSNVYTLSQSGQSTPVTVDIGFNGEYITVFTGFLKTVKYQRDTCTLMLKDRLWGLTERTVGDTTNPVSLSQIPSDIAWTLCTCYGGLDSTASTSNADIDYASFLTWASAFSTDNITNAVYYNGDKVLKSLTSLARMNESAIWVEGDGKIYFARFAEASSIDILITEADATDLSIDIDDKRLINRQHVFGNYDISSKDWYLNVTDSTSTSINSYGIREDVLKDDSVWFTSSVDALNIAARRLSLYSEPPKLFEVETMGPGFEAQISETVRLVDSFMAITSESAWRIVEIRLDAQSFKQTFILDGASTLDPFYLDVDILDGPKALL